MIQKKIFDSIKEAQDLLKKWRSEHQKIVFTNGCFDILHVGHVLYLQDAKSQGDKLIVGINSDDSVTRLKGINRPIKDLFDRSHVLAALESVDMVIKFDEDTPYELIKNIIPNVLVKGGDYSIENIVGSDIVFDTGGQVKTIPFIEGYSTTKIEGKIKGL